MGVVLTADGTLVARDYRVVVLPTPPRAVLADRHGRIWSQLSLLASVDRVDEPDVSVAVGAPEVRQVAEDQLEVVLSSSSTAWSSRTVRLLCRDDRLELTVTVRGSGDLGRVRLFGGSALLGSGATGTFRSSIEHRSVFVPTPTEPVQVVRPATSAAALGVLGDGSPGRVHAVFSPPPLCLVLGRAAAPGPLDVPVGDWLSVGVVAPVATLGFTELTYEPLDDGFLLALDYDGHTAVDGRFETPALVLRPVGDPWDGLRTYRDDLVDAGFAPQGPRGDRPAWWREPIFCGWGAQCARAPLPGPTRLHPSHLADLPLAPTGTPNATDLSRADVYDELLDHLAAHGVEPGTIVVDDRWQKAYGTAEPDDERWPDLRGWIARRHDAGQRVLLWWKAWDPAGVPADECLVDPSGRPVAVDVGNPDYLDRLDRVVASLVGGAGLDADGLKIDFTQRSPSGAAVRRPGGGGPWGVAALHVLLRRAYVAAKRAKPDALVVTHTPHPSFGDVCDMVRLDDLLESDPLGARVPAAGQAAVRAATVAACLPTHLVDTDQWPMTSLAEWREYVVQQAAWGVPALYYAERIDRSGEPLEHEDLALVASSWATYRARDGAR
ncbi:hypothetical protein, partial [Cellulomonas sp. URHD0024]|uniref:hypothetical protein n=1 Tax=Cellulomonas sp. URHD0024 TaxID=1302620 RepID=UPI00041E7F32